MQKEKELLKEEEQGAFAIVDKQQGIIWAKRNLVSFG